MSLVFCEGYRGFHGVLSASAEGAANNNSHQAHGTMSARIQLSSYYKQLTLV